MTDDRGVIDVKAKENFDDLSEVQLHNLRRERGGGVTRRFVSTAVLLLLLCSASFATSNVLLDAFQLRPIDDSHSPVVGHDDDKGSERGERYAALKNVLLSISDESELSRPNSPQQRALLWLADNDELKLGPKSTNLVQRYVLSVLFFSTTELQWHRELNWLASVHECEWKAEGGVRSCTQDKQEVTDISLWNNLKGTIPREIGQLTKLQVLYLARNQLYGTIPSEIGKLTDLTYLGLQHNRLSGTIPAEYMGNMLKLRTVYLEKNDFTGTIKRVDPLCQLKFDARPPKGQKRADGVLRFMTSDCKMLVSWKQPEIQCACCTQCYAA